MPISDFVNESHAGMMTDTPVALTHVLSGHWVSKEWKRLILVQLKQVTKVCVSSLWPIVTVVFATMACVSACLSTVLS